MAEEYIGLTREMEPHQASIRDLRSKRNKLKKLFCAQFGAQAQHVDPILELAAIKDAASREETALQLFGSVQEMLSGMGFTPEKLAALQEASDQMPGGLDD